MVARETTHGRLGEAKEIKVKIPLDFHIKLHTLKVLRGQSISDTVERALQSYFDDFSRTHDAVPDPFADTLRSTFKL